MMGLGPRKFGGRVRLVPQAFALVRQYLWERHGAGSHWWLYRLCGCGLSLRSGPCGHCSLSEAVVCVCVWKHLVTWCRFFRTRSDENKWWPQPFDSRFFLSGLNFPKLDNFPVLIFSAGTMITAFRFTTIFLPISISPEINNLPVLGSFSAGGQRGRGGSLANEDAPPIPCKRTCSGKRLSQEPQQFHRDSHDLYFGELQVGLRRTMLKFPGYVNRGLWDNLSLPRTIPDKHVELSSVCVSPPGATSSRLDGPSEKVQVR